VEDWLELYSLLIEIPTLAQPDHMIKEIVDGTGLYTLERLFSKRFYVTEAIMRDETVLWDMDYALLRGRS